MLRPVARVAALVRALVFAMLLLIPGAVRAQARLTGADLTGTVTGPDGAPLPAITIVATHLATNVARSADTSNSGRYVIPALQPGTYEVVVAAAGYATATREEVTLQLGQSVTADFALQVAALEETVVVLAEQVSLVSVRDASISSVVGQQQIESLPINGRDFISFAIITPGVAVDNTPQQGASATSGLSFAGQRARSNNVMVDGLDNTDASLGAVRAVFSQEAVQEFQVLTNGYSAEFGKASGGVVNIITKSGTNEVRGNLFGYYRDESLNSKNYFEDHNPDGSRVDRPRAPFDQLQYGATLGGPVIRDRTFYFLAGERLDQDASNLVTISAADAAILNAAGFSVTTGPNLYAVEQTQLLGKVDHQWSNSSSLVGRVNWSDISNQNVEPFGGLVAKSRGAVRLVEDTAFTLSQSNFAGSWVNEARFQLAQQDQKIYSLDPKCAGELCAGLSDGGPTLEIGRVSVGRQRFTPQLRDSTRYQLVDTVSFFAGDHQLKTGFDASHIESDDALPLHFGGRYIFTSMAAVAAGTPAAYVQGYGNPFATYEYQDASLFVQDEWRVTDRLTVNAGLRYQRQWFPDLAYDLSAPAAMGGRFRYSMPKDDDNVAPRLSLSYDPRGNGRSAFHASWGIFYDNVLTGIAFITDALDGGAGVRTLVATGPIAVTAWNSPGRRLSEAQVLALRGGVPFPSLVFAIDPELETPWSQQAALGWEQALGNDYGLSLNLLWVHGENQLGTIDYNPVVAALGPGRRPNDRINPATGLPQAGTSAQVLQYTSFGETWYQGLTLTLQKRYRNRTQFLLSYTLSEAEDNSTDFQSAFVPESMGQGRNPADPSGLPIGFDADSERGPATWDQRHRLVLSGLYELPWEVKISAIATYASGRPFTPLAGADLNGDGNGGAAPPDRARTNPADAGSSVGRNSERLPDTYTLDLRLSRAFAFGDRFVFEPVFEVFNALDRANYTDVNNIFGRGAYPSSPAPGYGQFTQAGAPRQFQLAAKLTF